MRNKVIPKNYPIDKEQAAQIQQMIAHPGWKHFIECLQFEADIYTNAMLSVPVTDPFYKEKMISNQAVSTNIVRIPAAINEVVETILDEEYGMKSLYDEMYLNS